MKKLNKKGFTLIELLAVIVILAVVLGIAIPAVSQYITKARKNGYVDNLLQFVDAARKGATLGDEYSFPVDKDQATIVSFDVLSKSIEKGGQKSSYDEKWNMYKSYVVIVNSGTADSPAYDYYVAATDDKYVTGTTGGSTIRIISEKSLKAADIVRDVDAKMTTAGLEVKSNCGGTGDTAVCSQKFTLANEELTVSNSGTISVTQVKATAK